MYDDNIDQFLLEQEQHQRDFENKLEMQSIRMKEEIVNGMYWEIEKRIQVYKDAGLTPSGMFYSEMKRFFTQTFASALVEVFEEEV